jgi:hypothetical protein
MKNLISVFVFLFAFALVASPALARSHGGNNNCGDCDNDGPTEECCPSVEISNMNMSKVKGMINTTANSGGNVANWNYGVGKIDTGNVTLGASVMQSVNMNETRLLAPTMGSLKVNSMNFGYADGMINAAANTGGNEANGNGKKVVIPATRCMPSITKYEAGRGDITTGNVTSVSEMVQFVGSNFTKTTN